MAEFFIRRPIVAMVISIVTVLLGFVAMSGLPIAQYPEITPPQVTVSASYAGADAETVASSVAAPEVTATLTGFALVTRQFEPQIRIMCTDGWHDIAFNQRFRDRRKLQPADAGQVRFHELQ